MNGGEYSIDTTIVGRAGTYVINAKDANGCVSANFTEILTDPTGMIEG